ncbi:hypothetical protein FRB94_000624 [Tulasnella sp. JGI-2019a]|nr:hypothetical protein FRB93_010412 [Tulasnella sp. JGI-2019a]KAG9006530.1 hypothetical protein FRB94_000624 [Tulasnella sp. JGI-2019a]KAG9032890.1 hypothetical protein FRB95_000905 [Tulasnella sp. JGI-2019a]
MLTLPIELMIIKLSALLVSSSTISHARMLIWSEGPKSPYIHMSMMLHSDSCRSQAVKKINHQLISSLFYTGLQDDPQPEVNIDNWLNPSSSSYQPLLHQSILHYTPRPMSDDQFQACFASREMQDATWKYGHRSQIILDGTFGVCDSCLLLFIVMAIDESNHGVPLVFFLFLAPTGNHQTSSGYDTTILTKLLSAWKQWLERDGHPFEPLVAITDMDV